MSRVVWSRSTDTAGPGWFEMIHDAYVAWWEDAPGELLTPGATSGRPRTCQPADGAPLTVLPDPDEGSPVPSSGSLIASST